ncbi:MAG: pyridoxal phosphate-dependent aminotransferase [Candidatus Hydrothermarchaeales archaeon]
MMISDRLRYIEPSPTLEITAKAKALKAKGIDVIGLGAGEPDFDTPQHIKNALFEAVDDGFIYYTPTEGIIELREAISEKLERDNKIKYDPDGEIIVTPGAKQALYEAIMAITNPEDEILIPDPWWVSYVPMVRVADGRPVFIPTTEENEFRLTAAAIEERITDKTKGVIINSPNNPTGVVLSGYDLKTIAAICDEHDLIVISDEIYEHLTYGVKHHSIASFDGMRERTITVNGFSKAYSMTGWRLGYAAGPRAIIEAMTKIQAHSISNTTSFVQKAGVVALRSPQNCVAGMVREFKNRRDVVVKMLNGIEDVSCVTPHGAFYAFPNVSRYERDSFKMADYLLNEAKVAVVPGRAFGECGEGFIRISYATSMDDLTRGIERIDEALKRLR